MNGQLQLLRALIHEGIHAATEFNVERLEKLIGQQEALLSGMLRGMPPPENTREAGSGELRELRRAGIIYSRVLLSTSRTVAALNAAQAASAAEVVN